MMVIMNEDTFLCVRVELHSKVSFCIVIVLSSHRHFPL